MKTTKMNKSLKDISWQVTEEQYRADKALSYSTLAKFAREGFNGLPKLFDKIETPSLTFGSAVDSIITGGQQEFDERFMVAEFPEVTDAIKTIVDKLFILYGGTHSSLYEITNGNILSVIDEQNYQQNWKPETRVKVVREKGDEYYKLKFISGTKAILTTEVYNDVLATVRALKESEATKWYFAEDNPFDEVQRFYQLKFKATLDGVDYRCMSDLLVVVPSKKLIIPVDLKTSGKPEWDFFKSFLEWRYDLQARLYWRIIRDNLDRDPIFKDYILADYKFIVANRKSLTPLVWEFINTKEEGTLELGKNKSVVLQDPQDIGLELSIYLSNNSTVPRGIKTIGINSLEEWINNNI